MPSLELPIFPLGIVLFPGTPQLLHIFEPRYRQMLADCLEGGRRFGGSYVRPEGQGDPAPEPGAVGGAAAVRESRLLPDGRSNVLTVGESRYVLTPYLPADLPYRVARVETFDDDDDADGPQLAETAGRLRTLFARFADGMQALSDRGAGTLEPAGDPKELSFQVSAGLEVDVEVKLRLLGLRATLGRLTHLARILRPLNEEWHRRVDAPVRTRGNGRGGATRDIVKGQ